MGTGSIFLALTLSVNVIALMVPYWAVWRDALLNLNNEGLWGKCRCQWGSFDQFVDEVENKSQDAWFLAVKAMYAIAVLFILIGLLIVFIISCCTKNARGILVAGIFLVIAAVLIIVCVVVFGAMGSEKWGLQLDQGDKFGWGFWLAVTGGILCLFTSIIYIHQGRGGAYALVES